MSSTFSDDSVRPGIGEGDVIAARRDVLYRLLASKATPVVQFPTAVRSAASLWAGVREWTRVLRSAGIVRGETIACASRFNETLLQLLLACLWDDLSLVLLDPAWTNHELLARTEAIDAQLLVSGPDRPSCERMVAWWCLATAGGWPDEAEPPVQRRDRDVSVHARECAVLQCADDDVIAMHDLIPVALHAGERLALRDGCVAVWGRVHGSHTLTHGVLAPLLHASEVFIAGSLLEGVALAPDEPYTHLLLDAADVQEGRLRWPRAHVSAIDDRH